MQYIWQHIRTIIGDYNGALPLSHFLKQYLARHPKLGSRDRKILSEMAYAWYRFSKGLPDEMPFEEKLRACLSLSHTDNKHILRFLPGEDTPTPAFNTELIFPFDIALSEGITRDAWLASMEKKPELFIRLRQREKVIGLLHEHNIPYQTVSAQTLALPNGTALDKILPAEAYAIQDASSQKTGEYFHPENGEAWWDCCSGAGGKSLLLTDKNPRIKLTVSDRRESILHNLSQRFALYRLPAPARLLVDMSNEHSVAEKLGQRRFDNIICDVPCSGSGTWARTPEQLYFFKPEMIEDMHKLQSRIAVNASRYLKPGGALYYITCSVFRKENEEVVAKLIETTGLVLEKQEAINGLALKADSMFISVLRPRA